jgi:hypothetical protein
VCSELHKDETGRGLSPRAYNQSKTDKTIQTWNTSVAKAVKIYEVQGFLGFSTERQTRKEAKSLKTTVDGGFLEKS